MADYESSRIEALLTLLNRRSLEGQRVLEAGRLSMSESRRLEALGAVVTTYESSEEAVAKSKAAFPHRECRRVDLSCPWSQSAPDRFDIVIALDVLDRLEDPAPFLTFARQIAPVLYLGGGRGDAVQSAAALLEKMDYIVTPVPDEDPDAESANLLLATQRRQDQESFFTPVLIHVHIPKCAGSTLKRLLSLSFGDRHIDVYDQNPDFVLEPDELVRLLQNQPQIVSIATHSLRTFPPLLGNRVPLYVTLLRDPRAQFLSYVTYVKGAWAQLSENHRRHVPPDGDTMSLRDFARWLVTSDENVHFKSDFTVNFLTENVFRDALRALSRRLDGNVAFEAVTREVYREVALDLAVSVLDDFFYVGLVEEMETSLSLLRQKLEPYGFALKTELFRRENVSVRAPGETAWLNEDDDVGRLVLQSLKTDIQLYDRFKERFTGRLSRTSPAGARTRRHHYEKLVTAAPQYGLREKDARLELAEARREIRLLQKHLKNIFSSRYLKMGWKTGIVKKPRWVDGFLHELEHEASPEDDPPRADQSGVKEA